jgi:dolichol-phosphate mannosyltransferase
VLVTVPTYNEADSLPGLVARLLDTLPGLRILVVDDGSPDGTGALADDMAAADPRVRVHHHAPRAGLGAAYIDAFRRLLGDRWAGTDGWADGWADGARWVVQMDADGSHAPEELPRLLAGAADADVVLGSRYVPGGATTGWAWHRRMLSRAGNVYSRRALRLRLHDVTGGYRCFRRTALAELGIATVASEGYCFQVDVAFRVERAGLRVREVPITFVEREQGESKMSGAVVREALWRITSWGLRDRARRHRARPGRRSGGLRRSRSGAA